MPLLVAFIIVSLVLCLFYSREGEDGILHEVQGSLMSVVSPLQRVGSTVGTATSAAEVSVADITADANTLSELTEQNQQLRALVSKTEEYRQEVDRLKGLLNMKNTSAVEGVTARVIGRSAEAWNQTITLDAGSSSGVSAGMTVLGSSGVVGQVVSCAPSTCTVRLLTDPNSGVAVTIQSNRQSGVVWGSLDGLLYLKSVDSSVPVQVGDVLVTSGMGGSFEKGLMVGTVVKVDETADAASRKIYVQANSSSAPLEEALIVGAGVDDSTTSSSSMKATEE